MGKNDYCCFVGCKSCRVRSKDTSFHRIPLRPASRRSAWLRAISRPRSNFKPADHTRVCSKHFVTGKPVNDINHVDYVPTILPHRKPKPVKERRVLPSIVKGGTDSDLMSAKCKQLTKKEIERRIKLEHAYARPPRPKSVDQPSHQVLVIAFKRDVGTSTLY